MQKNTNNLIILGEYQPSLFNFTFCLIIILWIILKLYYSHDINSFVSLESNVEWRYIGYSDLSKITESILAEGWKENIVDTKNWNIFNPYAHSFWSNDNTPLSSFYIENLQSGDVVSLKSAWPVANSKLDGLGLPSLPIRSDCLRGLEIHHEKILIGIENQISSSERIAAWLQDQKQYNLSNYEKLSYWLTNNKK